jgi:hypothetical protein
MAQQMENPTMRVPLKNGAEQFSALAVKLEAAWKQPPQAWKGVS